MLGLVFALPAGAGEARCLVRPGPFLVITTGEEDIKEVIMSRMMDSCLLQSMGRYLRRRGPIVPWPVNPAAMRRRS